VIVGVIFWGCTFLSVAVSVAGLVRRSPALLVAAAVLAVPISFYLGATPLLRWVGFFLPILLLLAALVVKRRRWPAIACVSLFITMPALLVVAAVVSNAGRAA
jgi:hypothetical protein